MCGYINAIHTDCTGPSEVYSPRTPSHCDLTLSLIAIRSSIYSLPQHRPHLVFGRVLASRGLCYELSTRLQFTALALPTLPTLHTLLASTPTRRAHDCRRPSLNSAHLHSYVAASHFIIPVYSCSCKLIDSAQTLLQLHFQVPRVPQLLARG